MNNYFLFTTIEIKMSSNINEDKLAKWQNEQFKNIITDKLVGKQKEDFILFMKEYRKYYIDNSNNTIREKLFYKLAYKKAGLI